MKPRLAILGIRGVPAAHGGFETFAEHLVLDLVRKGWDVSVYCQKEGTGKVTEDDWQGVRRIHVPVIGQGSFSTVLFDIMSTLAASRRGELCLLLGYNTAVLCALLRLRGVPVLINMDGIEWQRAKWNVLLKAWFRINEWAGAKLGNHLIADHPEIRVHLSQLCPASKITMIPYGSESWADAPDEPLHALNLSPGRFFTVIARAEPENSLLEIVQAYSRQPRGLPLVVLGKYEQSHDYQRRVLEAASNEVRFVGAIYDKAVLRALRVHSLAYVHGHQVGGTNPSLLEALGAGNAVIAHDNRFNRWVAGDAMAYFKTADDAAKLFDELPHDARKLKQMRTAATARHQDAFEWRRVLDEYEQLLLRWLPPR